MSELDQTAFDDERWGAKASVMKENIEHHIEEEEGEMFEKAEQLMEDSELERLGSRMEARKKHLESQMPGLTAG